MNPMKKSHWSVVRKTSNSICTQENLSQNIALSSRCLYFALICIPGLISIWAGLPLLPGRIICQPINNNVECRKTQSFLGIPTKTEIFRQQKSSSSVKEAIPGETTLVWIGVGYIGGWIFLIFLFSSTVVIKQTWTVDKKMAIVKLQKATSLRTSEKSYTRQEISGVSLEVTEILMDADPSHVWVRLNFRDAQQPVKFIPYSKDRPIIFGGECEHFEEVISTAKQMSEMLGVSLKLNIFSKYGSVLLDFSTKILSHSSQKNGHDVPFNLIQGFEVDVLSNGRHVVPTDSTAIHTYIHYEYIYQVRLILKNGECFSILNVESREAVGKSVSQSSFPTNDNRAYQWAKSFTQRVNNLIEG
jgi:hypothetical protein